MINKHTFILFSILWPHILYCQYQRSIEIPNEFYQEQMISDEYSKSVEKQFGLQNLIQSTDSINIRIAKITQVVDLKIDSKKQYKGSIYSYATHIKSKKTEELIFERQQIDSVIVKYLIESFLNRNISTIRDDSEIPGYPKGLDGEIYFITIATRNLYRYTSYWEPLDDYYPKPKFKDVDDLRYILKTLNETLKLDSLFFAYRDKWPKGQYAYGMIIFNKK